MQSCTTRCPDRRGSRTFYSALCSQYTWALVTDFLNTFLRSIFQEMISMDTLIVQIMNQAQKLVDADRASLFLVDNKNQQLYARFVQQQTSLIP